MPSNDVFTSDGASFSNNLIFGTIGIQNSILIKTKLTEFLFDIFFNDSERNSFKNSHNRLGHSTKNFSPKRNS